METTLTMKFIEEHIDKPWNWDFISGNRFNYYKRKRAAQKITRMCHNWIWKPL